MLKKMDKTDNKTLGYCQVRFLPKENGGFRPIMNLGKKILPSSYQKKSINDLLRNVHQVLNYHRHNYPHLMGSSVLGHGGVLGRLKSFKERNIVAENGQFYFVKFDVKSCFDSIPHEKMLQVLQKILVRVYFFLKLEIFCRKISVCTNMTY